jgi:biopolymer transport protein ExbD
MSRQRKKRKQGDVELNLAAMLDMAFQLLTFFILTFKPAPVEGQISLRLPPPLPIDAGGQKAAGEDTSSKELIKSVKTLTISVFADPNGSVSAYGIGEAPVATISLLDKRLKEIFGAPDNPFEQVVIQVGKALRYDELMRVVEVCTRQTLPDGSKLSKLSFVEAAQ